jgi:hypothetical protein
MGKIPREKSLALRWASGAVGVSEGALRSPLKCGIWVFVNARRPRICVPWITSCVGKILGTNGES